MPDTVHKKQGAVIYCPQNEHTRPRKNILSTHIVPTGTLYTPMGSGERMVERMLPVFDALYAYCLRRVQGHRDWANADAGWGERQEA